MASMAALPVPDGDASSDAAQKPKRARTSKPKVKTGCNNCKQRRIKCDEKRPACANCIRSKKICSGYPPPPRSARPFEEIKIAPKPLAPTAAVVGAAPPPIREPVQLPPRRVAKYQRRNTPPLTPSTPHAMMMLYHPSINLPFSDQEGQYFQLFREQTASELSGFFDSGFWTRSVLRECHAAAPIRHAVVALGALYKTLEKSNESPRSSPEGDPADSALRHWEMAFRQYSHACTALVKTQAADSTSHRTRLMASVLLACFDSFVGDHKQAIVQIQTGLGLLEQLRAERRRSFYATSEEPVEEELTQMFTRLAIQAKSYDMAFHFPQPWVVRLTSPNQGQDPSSPASDVSSPTSINHDSIPERFTSVMEARVTWDKLCERIFRFTETMFAHAQNGVMGVLPTSLQQYGISFKKDIEAWSKAFEHILASRTAPGISSQEKAAIAVLKSFQIMTNILFMMTFSDSEMHFDNFTPYFKAIVDLALEVVGDEERRAAAKRCPDPSFCHHQHRCQPDIFGGHAYAARHIKPSFSADLGIVPPLYVVATKCREPTIRRQAIQLLRSSARREGMWDSELTARIGMWIAEIEEEDFDLYPGYRSGSTIPTPSSSPVQTQSRPLTACASSPHPEFDNVPLGPGGNARASISSASTTSPPIGGGGFTSLSPRTPQASPLQEQKRTVPEERRVMVRAVEFDLRERSAVIQLGSRNLKTGTPDLKTRVTRIRW